MGPPCSICNHPKRPELDSRLIAEAAKPLAAELGMSLSAVYRHMAGKHHKSKEALGSQIAPDLDPHLTVQVSESLRDATRLMRLAWRHLKATTIGSDPKATNGAISSANKTLELLSELRGHLKARGGTQVNITADMRGAIDSHQAAQQLSSHDTTDLARSWLAAQLEAGDRDAMRIVMELVRLIPEAEVASTEPQRLTGALSPSADPIILKADG